MAILSVSTADDHNGFQKGTKVDTPKNATEGRGGRYYYVGNPADTCKTSPPGTSYCIDSNSCNPGGKVFVSYKNRHFEIFLAYSLNFLDLHRFIWIHRTSK